MATESDWICPVCHEARNDVAHVTPCLHKFCFGCITQWAKINPICPLCKRQLRSILFSVWADDDFVEVYRESSTDGPEDEEEAVEEQPTTYVAGLSLETWAALFRNEPQLADALRPWLREQLAEMTGADWWEVALLEATVVAVLCRSGLHEEALVQELQPSLQNYTVAFVQQLIDVAAECSEELLYQMQELDSPAASEQNTMEAGLEDFEDDWEQEDRIVVVSEDFQDAGEQEYSPVDSPWDTPPHSRLVYAQHLWDTDDEEPSSTSEPLDELRQLAAAEPAAQSYSRSPSAPGQGRERSRRGSRRPPKRRAGSAPDSPRPCKRPPSRPL